MHFRNILFILSLAFFSCSEAYVALERVAKNDAYPNQCYVERLKMALDFQKVYQVPNKCEQMKCDESYTVSIFGCSPFQVAPPCKIIEGNKKLPYPQCCPSPSC